MHRWLWTLWFGGRSSGTWRRPPPCWPWRAVVSLRSWRDVILAIYPPVGAVAHLAMTQAKPGGALLQARLIRSSSRQSDRHVARVFAEPMGVDLTGYADRNPVSHGWRERQGWRSPCALRPTRPDPSRANTPASLT